MTQKAAVSFLRNLQQDCVFKITHILTDSGVQFTYNLLNEAQRPDKEHPFDELYRHLGIEHLTTLSVIRGRTGRWKSPIRC